MKKVFLHKIVSILLVLTLGTTFVVLSSTSNAQSIIQVNYTYHNWEGYEGNSTFYMVTNLIATSPTNSSIWLSPDIATPLLKIQNQSVIYSLLNGVAKVTNNVALSDLNGAPQKGYFDAEGPNNSRFVIEFPLAFVQRYSIAENNSYQFISSDPMYSYLGLNLTPSDASGVTNYIDINGNTTTMGLNATGQTSMNTQTFGTYSDLIASTVAMIVGGPVGVAITSGGIFYDIYNLVQPSGVSSTVNMSVGDNPTWETASVNNGSFGSAVLDNNSLGSQWYYYNNTVALATDIQNRIPLSDFSHGLNFNVSGSIHGISYGYSPIYYNYSVAPAVQIAGNVSVAGKPEANSPVSVSILSSETQGTNGLIYNYNVYNVTTNQYGEYRFFAPPQTDYQITAAKIAVKGETISITKTESTGNPGTTDFVNFNLQSTATISGRAVAGSNGPGAPEAAVTLNSPTINGVSYQATTTTDSNGFYTFYYLPFASDYTISVSLGGKSISSSINVSSLNGSQQDSSPTGVGSSVSVSITNSQSVATSNPYNQEVIINSNRYYGYESPHLGNVIWYTSSGTIIPSWIESGNSNTSTQTIYWLKIPFSLGGDSATTIYMGFISNKESTFSPTGNEGEAPQLSPSYAEYDNGANVFPVYFNGNTPTSDFSTHSGITLGQTSVAFGANNINTLYWSTSGIGQRVGGWVFTHSSFGGSQFALSASFKTTSSNTLELDAWNTNSVTSSSISAVGVGTASSGNLNSMYVQSGSWGMNQISSTGPTGWIYLNDYALGGTNYVSVGSNPVTASESGSFGNNPVSGASTLYAGSFWADADGVAMNMYVNYEMLYPALPNGVMPYYSLSEVPATPSEQPAGLINYIPIVLSNAQSSATPAPYDQMIKIDSAQYWIAESTNLSNVIWFTKSGVIIPSWIANGDNSNSKSTVYWLKIPFSISAGSYTTIFMGFKNLTTHLFSPTGNEGVAPQLTTQYGQYDNGKVVFTGGYWNFANTSLPSGWKWTNYNTGGTASESIDNGIKISFQGNWWYTMAAGTNSSSNHANYAFYTYQMTTNYASMNTMFGAISSYGGSVQSHGYQSVIHGYVGSMQSNTYFIDYAPGTNNAGTNVTGTSPGGLANTWYLTQEAWPSTGTEYSSYYNSSGSREGSPLTGQDSQGSISNTYLYLGMYDNKGGGGDTYYQYAFLAPLLPNNVMPTYSIYGSSTSTITGYQAPTVTFPGIYAVNFKESGLNGQRWSVNFGNQKQSTTESSLTFYSPNGNVQYSVSGVMGDSLSPTSGSIAVNSAPVTVSVTYTPNTDYNVHFTQSGLPAGADWNVTLNGNTLEGINGADIAFTELNGIYSYNIPTVVYGSFGGLPVQWIPNPSKGSVNVQGQSYTIDVTFTQLSSMLGTTELMLANGTYVQANNVTVGDRVATYDLSTGTLQSGFVEQIFEDNHTAMYTINGELQVSPNQLIYTSNGWVEAQYLHVNDWIKNPLNGHESRVDSISKTSGAYVMYGFVISNNNNLVAWKYLLYGG